MKIKSGAKGSSKGRGQTELRNDDERESIESGDYGKATKCNTSEKKIIEYTARKREEEGGETKTAKI